MTRVRRFVPRDCGSAPRRCKRAFFAQVCCACARRPNLASSCCGFIAKHRVRLRRAYEMSCLSELRGPFGVVSRFTAAEGVKINAGVLQVGVARDPETHPQHRAEQGRAANLQARAGQRRSTLSENLLVECRPGCSLHLARRCPERRRNADAAAIAAVLLHCRPRGGADAAQG
jgi:hypothetical protein